ncbi:HEPN domain-containing protein [Streptomyces anulatus]|uniref:HEPN domain-containing protein n=1 Tax=Streptomyces anulatus TaxID=1892 RepID=UPI0033FB2DD4
MNHHTLGAKLFEGLFKLPEQVTPLKLSYEPDDYLCTWILPHGEGETIELPGNLKVLPMRPPTGVVYGSVPLESHSKGVFSFPQTVQVTALTGIMANGGSVILLDASITYWSMGKGHISGSAALLGHGRDIFGWPSSLKQLGRNTTPLVSSVKFQISALDAIIGTLPIKSVQTPGRHRENPTDLWSATVNLEASSRWETQETSLHVGYDGRMNTAGGYEFTLAYSPVASFKINNHLPLRSVMDELVEPLRRIISISTGAPQDLTYLSVELDSSRGAHQVFGTGITQNPFTSSSKDVRSKNSAILARADNLSLLDLVLKWREYTAEHHPLVETYGSMLHVADQHPRSRFLLLIQALEGLHGHETRDDFEERKQKHLLKRKSAIEAIEGKVDSATLSYLKKSISKSPPTSLESALNATVQGLPVNTMDRLAKTELVTDVMSQSPTPTTAASALRVVRNNLAHGNRGYDAHELDEVVKILELIVRGHSLRILGCPESVVKRVFDRT